MRASILASDSMGVRSLALLVETPEGLIGVDLGVSIAPRRYGLPPHEIELRRLEESLDVVRRALTESSIVIITHYHYDHYIKDEPYLYKNKILLIKNPKKDINRSQAIRSYVFLKKYNVESLAKKIKFIDNKIFNYNKIKIEFSQPVWHGYPGSKVGKVIMVKISCCNESIIYTSDVQGPADPNALNILAKWCSDSKPQLIVTDAPPTYFAGFKVPKKHVEAGLQGMLRLLEICRPETMVIDHHLLRDKNYLDKIKEHNRLASELGVRLITGAEYMKRPIEQLEARRRELWKVP